MTNLDHLFTFPIIMVDGDNEDKKEQRHEILGIGEEEEIDLIEGEACIPYYDFISVSDRWLPTEESFNNALGKKFDACGVLFANSGTYIVPWNKEKFKKELKKFIDKQPKDSMGVLHITKDSIKGLLND